MARTIQKRYRATPEEIAKRKSLAFAAVRKRRGWFGHGDIATRLSGDPYLTRTLSLLVADKLLRKRGDRRLTQYQVRA